MSVVSGIYVVIVGNSSRHSVLTCFIQAELASQLSCVDVGYIIDGWKSSNQINDTLVSP